MSLWNFWSANVATVVRGEGAQASSPFFVSPFFGHALLAATLLSGLTACTKSSPDAASLDPATTAQTALVTRGRAIYAANCTACHNSNPARPGALGPEVAGASLELLQARVLHASYPPGYTPKRQTRQMIALPQLAGELEALAAYLRTR